MAILLDTSILARIANQADADHALAQTAVDELHRRGESLHITPQNLIEFRSVATRPLSVNGFGLSPSAAEALAATFEKNFAMLNDVRFIYPTWKRLVESLGVIGKQVHDARLVAVCHAYHISHLLTFNVAHFARFSGVAPGIVVIDPATV